MQAWLEAIGSGLLATLAPLTARVVGVLIILLVSWRLAAAARNWFERATARSRADVNVRVLVARFLYLSVLIYGLLWALEVFGVSPAALVTALGVLGLAASLALQDLLKNFCSGVYLLFERPFRIGDEITVKDFRGRVVDVGMRTTSLRTEDDLQVLIPNAVVLAEVLVNRSTYPAAPATPDRLADPEP